LGFSKVFDYMAGKIDWMTYGLPVEGASDIALIRDRLVREWPVCRITETTSGAKQRAQAHGAGFCLVLNDEGIVLGVVGRGGWEMPESMAVEEIMDPAPTTLRPSVSVDNATEFLEKHNLDAIVVTSSDGKFMGVFRRQEPEPKKQIPKSSVWS
jgi:CBS domain-containing protein